jgi:putative transposase
LLSTFINTLLSAEADAVCGAAYGQASPDRTNRRNGYRHRDFDTRTGTLDVAIPKLRTGSYFPEWLLERRKRAQRALTSVVATPGPHRLNNNDEGSAVVHHVTGLDHARRQHQSP